MVINVDYDIYITYSRNKDTKVMLYRDVLSESSDINFFRDLCEMISSDFNSFKFVSIVNLCKIMNLKKTWVSTKINKLERLNMIRREDEYIYINPKYCKAYAKVNKYTVDMFSKYCVDSGNKIVHNEAF